VRNGRTDEYSTEIVILARKQTLHLSSVHRFVCFHKTVELANPPELITPLKLRRSRLLQRAGRQILNQDSYPCPQTNTSSVHQFLCLSVRLFSPPLCPEKKSFQKTSFISLLHSLTFSNFKNDKRVNHQSDVFTYQTLSVRSDTVSVVGFFLARTPRFLTPHPICFYESRT